MGSGCSCDNTAQQERIVPPPPTDHPFCGGHESAQVFLEYKHDTTTTSTTARKSDSAEHNNNNSSRQPSGNGDSVSSLVGSAEATVVGPLRFHNKWSPGHEGKKQEASPMLTTPPQPFGGSRSGSPSGDSSGSSWGGHVVSAARRRTIRPDVFNATPEKSFSNSFANNSFAGDEKSPTLTFPTSDEQQQLQQSPQQRQRPTSPLVAGFHNEPIPPFLSISPHASP